MPALVLAVAVEDGQARRIQAAVEESFTVAVADSAPQCLRTLYQERPELVLLDLERLGRQGLELCRVIRQMCDVPVLCLISPECVALITRSLEAGADACADRSASAAELGARLQALLRRAGNGASAARDRLVLGDIVIDFDAHEVSKAGEPVALTPREFMLMESLAERPNTLLSHEELLRRVWGPDFADETHYLRLYIGYLRQKLEDDPRNPRYIVTERGVGYKLSVEPAVPESTPLRAKLRPSSWRARSPVAATG